MPVSVITNLFNQAAVLRAKGDGDVSVPVKLVSNEQRGECSYAAGLLFYHDGWFGKVGQFYMYHSPTFSTQKALSQVFNDGTDPHTDPPQTLPPFDPRGWKDLALVVTAEGVVRYYRPNEPSTVRTFVAGEVGINQVIYGVGMPIHPPVGSLLVEELAALISISFGTLEYTPRPQ